MVDRILAVSLMDLDRSAMPVWIVAGFMGNTQEFRSKNDTFSFTFQYIMHKLWLDFEPVDFQMQKDIYDQQLLFKFVWFIFVSVSFSLPEGSLSKKVMQMFTACLDTASHRLWNEINSS